MIVVEAAGITDTGRKRTINEDRFFVDDDLKLYVVADGMGGHAAGEIASQIAVDTLHGYAREVFRRAEPATLPDVGRNLSRFANQLLAGIYLANKNVYEAAREKSARSGMGTTVSAVLFTTDDSFITANVGDSPVFLLRDGRMKMISVMHTVASEASAINPDTEKSLRQEFSHVLTQAIGTKNQIHPDVEEIPCLTGDIIIISSDGLTDMVSTTEIQQVVETDEPAAACQKLVHLANRNGGNDNITIIVLNVKITRSNGFLSRIRRFFGATARQHKENYGKTISY